MSSAIATPTPTEVEETPSGNARRNTVLALLVVAVLVAGGWFFVLKPAPPGEPKPGEVVQLEPIQVNLAGGHYLRLGLALQLSEEAQEVEGSKALDAAIAVFSGRGVGEVNQAAVRESLRTQLAGELTQRYEGDVLGVYFTEYVTQ